jgi:hypothetical protein
MAPRGAFLLAVSCLVEPAGRFLLPNRYLAMAHPPLSAQVG